MPRFIKGDAGAPLTNTFYRRTVIESEVCMKGSIMKTGIESSVEEYVKACRNLDGGYAFTAGVDSNAQDTYYALCIFNILEVPPPDIDRTTDWLLNFPASDLHAPYYVDQVLVLCGIPVRTELKKFVERRLKTIWRKIDTYVEVASEFDSLFMMARLIRLANIDFKADEAVAWLLSFANPDGGFGMGGRSTMASTYHAVSALIDFRSPVFNPKLERFVRSCERRDGGFASVPSTSRPFMEDTFFGVSLLKVLNRQPNFPVETINFVLRCQNANGGFARSEIGISTLEDTFLP